jgi:hypothetical protein
MKLMVIPEARLHQVETVIREVLGPYHRGTEELNLVIVRTIAPMDWAVHVSGLGDPVLEASYGDVIRQALRRTDG